MAREIQSNQSMGDPPSRFTMPVARIALVAILVLLAWQGEYGYPFVLVFAAVLVVAGINPKVIRDWLPITWKSDKHDGDSG